MIKLKCKHCETNNWIDPPKKKLKKTERIELNCFNCGMSNDYRYFHKIDREVGV